MKTTIFIFFLFYLFFLFDPGYAQDKSDDGQSNDKSPILNTVADWQGAWAECRPIPMDDVQLSGFLGKRIQRNLSSVLEGMKCPMPKGFEARATGKDIPSEAQRLAADSDLYKWLEGACYVYAQSKDPEIKNGIDYIVNLILQCQKLDGYINTQVPPKQRFDRKINHDLYIAGHFFEAAVAHYRATQQRNLLEAAVRWADYLIAEYENGNSYYQYVGKKEHPEYELGFLRLYRATGDRRYLDFSIKLASMSTVGQKVSDIRAGDGVLHAVRVGYLLTALADLYMETGNKDLYQYLPGLWDELVNTRLYVTGGMGYRERIPAQPYYLPHSLDYSDHSDIAETCASVAMIMFSWRLHSITKDSRYFDLIETIFYNHYLGAIALNQLGNFYYNPVKVVGNQTGRSDMHGPKTYRLMMPDIHRTACCLPNSWRFFGALPEYVFSYDKEGLYVNLYTSAVVKHQTTDGMEIKLDIKTDYPHNGNVSIHFTGSKVTQFKLRLRIPAWCRKAVITFTDGKTSSTKGGEYYSIDRIWKPGEEINVMLAMPVQMIYSDSRIAANLGQVVFKRGPLVYCLENQDVDFPVELARVAMRPDELGKNVKVTWHEELLDGINVLNIPGIIASVPGEKGNPYFTASPTGKPVELRLIPFYARANRGKDNRWVTFIPLSPKPEMEIK